MQYDPLIEMLDVWFEFRKSSQFVATETKTTQISSCSLKSENLYLAIVIINWIKTKYPSLLDNYWCSHGEWLKGYSST